MYGRGLHMDQVLFMKREWLSAEYLKLIPPWFLVQYQKANEYEDRSNTQPSRRLDSRRAPQTLIAGLDKPIVPKRSWTNCRAQVPLQSKHRTDGLPASVK